MEKHNSIIDLNNDKSLDDIKVQWCGNIVRLLKNTSCVGIITADENAVKKIERLCIKNAYRCSQIQNGKIML